MKINRLINNIIGPNDAKSLEAAALVLQCLAGNPHFTSTIPTLAVLQVGYSEYGTAVTNALSGDKLARAVRDAKKEILTALFLRLSFYIQLTADNNRTLLQSSGYPLVKEQAPQPGILQPSIPVVAYTDQIGVLTISIKKVKGAAAYMHQYTTDPEMKEETLVTMPCTSTKCVLQGLIAGTVYYFRVGVVGSKDQVKYSDYVSKLAA